jgi:HSP90 family molecular chaperone
LKEEAHDFLEENTLKNLVTKYSQFITFNIYLWESTVSEYCCDNQYPFYVVNYIMWKKKSLIFDETGIMNSIWLYMLEKMGYTCLRKCKFNKSIKLKSSYPNLKVPWYEEMQSEDYMFVSIVNI